ncbi:MAG: hypothetical protein E7456_03810 [Ruminococcaceae bacterium]|nr:hypothetical protein [Oscillospiraceae bacterium]
MIGMGLKKLAAQHGMKVASGVAYGDLKGYATTMKEGNGYKMIAISTKFEDASQAEALISYCNQHNIRREYRVMQLDVALNGIVIVFQDNPGTMKKIIAFIDWFYPLLPKYNAAGVDKCAECGLELIGGTWKLVNGLAVHLHEGCANSLENKIEVGNEKREAEAKGSYFTGFIGALLGALIGAVLWGVVASFGFISAIIGFIIGYLAELGYKLLRGKKGKGKLAILILAAIIGVIVGTFLGDAFSLVQMINSGEIMASYSEIPGLILYVFLVDSEYMVASLGNVALGLLFAGLGVFTLFRKAGKEVADDKIVDLK